MVTNFEEITSELTEKEMEILPYLVKGFGDKTKENPIKAPDIILKMNAFLKSKKSKVVFTEPRLRKMVNYIRSNGLLPVIATSNGYYVSYDKDELLLQIKSLNERANSIYSCADGLKTFLV